MGRSDIYTDCVNVSKGANPQRVSTEIIIEIKKLNTGRMALHAFIESVWCSHWEIIFSSKMEKQLCKFRSIISITLKLKLYYIR